MRVVSPLMRIFPVPCVTSVPQMRIRLASTSVKSTVSVAPSVTTMLARKAPKETFATVTLVITTVTSPTMVNLLPDTFSASFDDGHSTVVFVSV